MWDLPTNAHRYLVEQLAGEHAYTMLCIRFVRFVQNIQKSEKFAVQLMLRKVVHNLDTITGRNMSFIQKKVGQELDLLSVKPEKLKGRLKFFPIENENIWRVNMIKEITNINQNMLYLNENDDFLTKEELRDIMHYACSS